MVISTGLFIDGRVGELDLIRAGWLFMHRTMSDGDRMRFEQMINTPGFCVKKFEEMFLLRRINPFAPSEEQRIMMFDHSDCACKNAQDAREISEMKKQLGDFLARWENVFQQLPSNLPSLTSSDALPKITDLQEQTAKQLINMGPEKSIKAVSVHVETAKIDEIKENGSKENSDKEDTVQQEAIQKDGSKEIDTNQNNDKKDEVSEPNEDIKKTGTIETASTDRGTPNLGMETTTKQDAFKKKINNKNSNKKGAFQEKLIKEVISKVDKTKKIESSQDASKSVESVSEDPKTTTPPHHGNAVAEQCLWNVAHVTGKPTHPKLQYAEAAASGVVKPVKNQQSSPSDLKQQSEVVVHEHQPVDPTPSPAPLDQPAESIEPAEPCIEKPITVACVEDKMDIPMSICTDISPAITDNSRSAGTPDSGMISDISEVKTAESEVDNSEKEASKSKDPEKMTGRDGRRYRQKLREAEKAALAQIVTEESVEDVTQEGSKRESIESETTESENTAPTGKEKRRLKDKLRKEKKEQEKLLQPSEQTKEESSIPVPEAISTPEQHIDDTHVASNASEFSVAQIFLKSDAPIAVPEELSDRQSSEEPVAKKETEVTPDDGQQVKRLSKSQKKRAQKKAAKGVYVVNDNGSHSVELLPGEYEIVQLDQDRNIKEVEFVNREEREVNGDEKVEEKKGDDVVVQPKKRSVKNLLVAGNLSKEILDKGKWLAYVIDEKNPNSIPKFGEVSTVDVAKTIKMLDSQMSAKQPAQPDGYVDDVDYSCTKSPGHISTTIRQILPELDADVVRENFAKLIEIIEPGCYAGPTEEEIATQPPVSDLQLMIDQPSSGFKFHTELARRTSPLLVGNEEFREFCIKYSKSKYDSNVISSLIKKYVDTRIVYHYERYKKLADREHRRISKCWTKVTDSSPFALMLMLYVNNPTSNVEFSDIEAVLFPQP